jgi:thiol-disulfide isomerase/thioredoxin
MTPMPSFKRTFPAARRALPAAALILAGVLLALAGDAVPSRSAARLELSAAMQEQIRALPQVRGAKLGAEALRGKVVMVTFFASWCPPCRVEMEYLKDLYATHRERGLEILAVNLFEDFDDLSDDRRLKAYLRRVAPEFPVVKGSDAISAAFGKITRIPSLFVFDRAGRAVFHFTNERAGPSTTADPEKLKALVTQLL